MNHLKQELEAILVNNFKFFCERHQNVNDYPFIDMKFKTFNGQNFEEFNTTDRVNIYSKEIIYGLTKCRGIEALAGHLSYFKHNKHNIDKQLICNAELCLQTVTQHLEKLRLEGDGHAYFMMPQTAMVPLQIEKDNTISEWTELNRDRNNITDIFMSKGLLKAAFYLRDKTLLESAESYFLSLCEDVLNRRIVNDRQAMDPKNPVMEIPGRHTHAYHMLTLGGIAIAIESGYGDTYIPLGMEMINFINTNYINQGQFSELQTWDFLEYLNQDQQPWQDNKGQIWCDPGHALEFIGLALKVYYGIKRFAPKFEKELQELEHMAQTIFLPTLIHVFNYGFQPEAHGIMKAYNLKDRVAINSDMPWWSLPETIRAVCELKPLVKKSNDLERILSTAHHSHQNHFIREDFHLFAYQTRGINNKPIDIIPAMPDTDPIYHTGLSLIDALKHL